MKTEIWKALQGVPGIEVSTFGRVRTLDKMVWNGLGTWLMKGRVLKQSNDKYGYLQVGVSIDGKRVTKKVHRLVALTFISNPDNLPQVNHLDCDRTNNNVDNLEWCTPKYNSQYREKYGISATESLGHPIFAVNLTTLKVSRYQSQSEAGRALGVDYSSITKVIKGKRNQAGGYWFVSDDGHAVDVVKSKLHDIGKTGLKIKCQSVH